MCCLYFRSTLYQLGYWWTFYIYDDNFWKLTQKMYISSRHPSAAPHSSVSIVAADKSERKLAKNRVPKDGWCTLAPPSRGITWRVNTRHINVKPSCVLWPPHRTKPQEGEATWWPKGNRTTGVCCGLFQQLHPILSTKTCATAPHETFFGRTFGPHLSFATIAGLRHCHMHSESVLGRFVRTRTEMLPAASEWHGKNDRTSWGARPVQHGSLPCPDVYRVGCFIVPFRLWGAKTTLVTATVTATWEAAIWWMSHLVERLMHTDKHTHTLTHIHRWKGMPWLP